MITLSFVVIAACIFIMHKYHKIKNEYLLASLYLLLVESLELFNYEFFYVDDGVVLVVIGFITVGFAYISKRKDFESFNAYAVLSAIYSLHGLEDMIIDHGLLDSVYYLSMYGGTLYLVYTVIYDRLAPVRYILNHYVRKLVAIVSD